jgi:hypothetical protein
LASALALTWEVGYFVAIRGGAFALFNIAEHLTFALQALPIALLVTSAGLVGLVRGGVAYRHPSSMIIVLLTMGAISVVWYFFSTMDFSLIILIFVALLPYLMVSFVPRRLLINPMFIYGGALVTFFAAILIGYAEARLQIFSPRPLNSIKFGEKGKDTETEMKVRILRTGERGILYFDPATQTFGLLPWDYVKRVDWAISPLLRHL